MRSFIFAATALYLLAGAAAARTVSSSDGGLVVLVSELWALSSDTVYRWIDYVKLPSPSGAISSSHPPPASPPVASTTPAPPPPFAPANPWPANPPHVSFDYDYAYESKSVGNACYDFFRTPCLAWYDGDDAASLHADQAGNVGSWFSRSDFTQALVPRGGDSIATRGALLTGSGRLEAKLRSAPSYAWTACLVAREIGACRVPTGCSIWQYGGASLSLEGSDLVLAVGASEVARLGALFWLGSAREPKPALVACIAVDTRYASLHLQSDAVGVTARSQIDVAPENQPDQLVLGPAHQNITVHELFVLSAFMDASSVAVISERLLSKWK